MSKIYRLNWRPDLPDFRDWVFSLLCPEGLKAKPRARTVDLRSLCPPVVNQGDVGSCTGNAIASALEFIQLKGMRDEALAPLPHEFTETEGFDPISRLFIYYNEREEEGDPLSDNGAQLRTGIDVIKSLGFCRESLWPYDESKWMVKPPAAAYAEAKHHKSLHHYRLRSLTDMKKCLAAGYPFVFGMTVFSSFVGAETARTGIARLPKPSEPCMGGHAVMGVGYCDVRKSLIVRNSWGAGWGQQGYFYLPYEFVENDGLADDFWTFRIDPAE